jgi:3-oxoacyl-[acyl-carrier protein] reductase
MLAAFAASGANVWAHARELTPEFKSLCEETAAKSGVEVWPLGFELTDYDAMKSAVKEIMASKRPVDGLVNNAGITHNALFQMSRIEDLRGQMEVNFIAPYIFTQYILKLMVKNQKGAVVNIASTAGLDGNSGKSAYGASKAALIAMTKSIAKEMGSNGIRVNCIAPGITETEMLSTMPEQVVRETRDATDLRRAALPSDIAQAAVFLVSDLSAYMTGQVVRIDGGM